MSRKATRQKEEPDLHARDELETIDVDLEEQEVSELPEREAISLVNPGSDLTVGISAAAGLLPGPK